MNEIKELKKTNNDLGTKNVYLDSETNSYLRHIKTLEFKVSDMGDNFK
eukprot:CAMPEP_0170567992 /NCGR_PEP_ID=MMETSP0211-20121228/80846_1 /TAXON_ID=311385 /ORGANISM="Pseudokeronopsis sp., Strain OXSARD2" /LENGTH=47 /DNA_ID= /DNA_START= /DNA_END= /DNA_ORIENTATION=